MESPNSLRVKQSLSTVPRSERAIFEYWSAVATKEPISNALKALVRADLIKLWHFERSHLFRENMRICWTTVDDWLIVLKDTIGQLAPAQLQYLCNKPTACYFLQSAQELNAYGARTLIPVMVYEMICGEWFRTDNNVEPSIEFDHFFANPIRITSTGPSTVHGVINAHLSLCAQASHLMNQVSYEGVDMAYHFRSNIKHYSLFPLYRAIVVMIDESHRFKRGSMTEPDGLVSLRKQAQIQTILIARTGAEEGLSAPISFESLRSHFRPLQRIDVMRPNVDVVRVSIAVAVKFIASLEAREELAFSKLTNEVIWDPQLAPNTAHELGETHHISCSPDLWADAHLMAAEEYGYDKIYQTWESIRRVKADLVGEKFYELEHLPFRPRWKYWD